MELFSKYYKTTINFFLLIFICSFVSANNSCTEDIVIATIGASVTGGVTGYSPAQASDTKTDNFIEKYKKQSYLYSIKTHLYPYRTLASIIEKQQSNYQNKVTVIDAFTKSNFAYHQYFTNISNMFFVTGFIDAIFNPLSSLKRQINYAKSKNAQVIIGIDMFFWSIYNNYIDNIEIKANDDANYTKQLQQIDKILDYLDLPENRNINFVVGNIPCKRLRFFTWQLDPTQELIDLANTKIANWVEKRNQEDGGKVLLIDTILFFTFPEKYAELFETNTTLLVEELVSTDDLHPSFKGQELIAEAILKMMAKSEYKIFNQVGSQFN